jgi:Zn-finger nucleic acid-binding protein
MAKCSYCSAPMPHSGIICEYCGKRNDIDLRGEKKRVNLRPHESRHCPVCDKGLFTVDVGLKIPLFIEHCESCYGLFFDLLELEELVASKVKPSSNVDFKKIQQLNNNPRYIDVITYRRCPVCKNLMNRQNYAKRSGVIMDVCAEHGIWLDPGELTHILEWSHTAGHLPQSESIPTETTDIPKARERTIEMPETNQARDIIDIFWDLFDYR